jgi:VanZ family protein
LLLLTLTHLPRLGPIPKIPGGDKTLHFTAYFLAALLLVRAFLQTARWVPMIGFILGLWLLGALDEWTQPYVNRTCDFGDWLADAGGTAVAAFACAVHRRFG